MGGWPPSPTRPAPASTCHRWTRRHRPPGALTLAQGGEQFAVSEWSNPLDAGRKPAQNLAKVKQGRLPGCREWMMVPESRTTEYRVRDEERLALARGKRRTNGDLWLARHASFKSAPACQPLDALVPLAYTNLLI